MTCALLQAVHYNKHLCPVCRVRPAISPHHIKPVAEGGTDDKKNIVDLCKRCHDIAEEIYDRTGMKYSPSLVRLIRLKFKFTAGPRAEVAHVSNTRQPGPKFKFRQLRGREPSPTPVVCPNCGVRHLPKKFSVALCMECSGENARNDKKAGKETDKTITLVNWTLSNHVVLASSNKRIYIDTNGRVYTMSKNGLFLQPYRYPRLSRTTPSHVLRKLACKVTVG